MKRRVWTMEHLEDRFGKDADNLMLRYRGGGCPGEASAMGLDKTCNVQGDKVSSGSVVSSPPDVIGLTNEIIYTELLTIMIGYTIHAPNWAS
ncbi:hypothetical protein B0O99DRAFT_81960 [Bisporella sp. PMI_857]|nr:hypothetical protein B0O99DRAFT_81960 [Bisporella sp. PMI_857]